MQSFLQLSHILASFLSLIPSSIFALTHEEALEKKFIPRSQWSQVPDYSALDVNYDGQKEIISLHHTVTGSGYDKGTGIPEEKELIIMKQIEAYHRDNLKFSDMGYHYVVTPSGHIYECRQRHVQGAHTFKLNPKNIGVAFLGCYDETTCTAEGYTVNEVTPEMLDSAARLAAYLSLAENFILSSQNLIARSSYDIEKLGSTRFPGSPGNRIIEKLNELRNKANAYVVEFTDSNFVYRAKNL